jgi:predicted Zn-dependent protease
MAAAPTLSDLQAAADRALEHVRGEGQVLAVWDRRALESGVRETLSVTMTVVHDGRAGEAVAAGLEDASLEKAARGAWLRAGQARAWPAPPLPPPRAAEPHDGFDPAALTAEPVRERREGVDLVRESGAARIAVASTAGVRAAEERSHFLTRARAAVRGGGRTVTVTGAAVGPAAATALLAEAAELLAAAPAGGPSAPSPGPVAVVLGPEAVAAVLDRLRSAFGVDAVIGAGPLAGRLGTTVAAACVHLTEDAHHPDTLPRASDPEGVPRAAVTLLAGGIAQRIVLDSAAAQRLGHASTGHATRPLTLAPFPEHLVLAGGHAGDAAELAAPLDDGLYIPAIGRDDEGVARTRGARRIQRGRLGGGVADAPVRVDPLAVLAATEDLTAGLRLVGLRGHAPGGIGAALVPALRARFGIEVLA